MFKPGDLVRVRNITRFYPHSKDPREIGGVGVVTKVFVEPGSLIRWYDVFVNGLVIDNIIDNRVVVVEDET